ncbi:hypothetical protein MCAG_00879 [Micromonospora sp. ATCC 39149]|uniref:hypothetical protein n=1 Tax=Micromonospora sp. (strain ATCC 39149 / NRRL 15099 / SCC 1413) TaxID=219305 RepID=UPI0001A50E0A|nr:hypothetical protein [Micromonospora sp. ATCC 39149]EEP70552.1 hypothetical protein MCAG_00879 [Micromonospora sp. ATCC 39149]
MRRDLLQTVVVKGIAETSAVADAADVPVADAEGVLADLAAAGLIRRRTGRLAGWTPAEERAAKLGPGSVRGGTPRPRRRTRCTGEFVA